MAKSEMQKAKLLYLKKIFEEETDGEHPITMSEIIGKLETYGISAERKSIYTDIEILRDFGMDIISQRGKASYYFLGSREFELPEIKLLADAVSAAKFVSDSKTKELIRKLKTLCSTSEGREISRQLFLTGRVKSDNRQIYYNVDKINQSILLDKKITFKYYSFDINKQKQFKNDGKEYTASPYMLTWDDENYYMTAFNEKYNDISNFRVDKMENIQITDVNCMKMPVGFDPASYSKTHISMFSGESERVIVRFDKKLIGVVIDKFGIDVTIVEKTEETFDVSVPVYPGNTFFGWLFQFGEDAEIIYPQRVREDYKNLAEKTARKNKI